MGSSHRKADITEIDDLHLDHMELDTAYVLKFAPQAEDQPGRHRYVVLYRHSDYQDHLLIVEAAGGSQGIVRTIMPQADISIGDPVHVTWQSEPGPQGWSAGGRCIKISVGGERTLNRPLMDLLVAS